MAADEMEGNHRKHVINRSKSLKLSKNFRRFDSFWFGTLFLVAKILNSEVVFLWNL